MVAYLLHACQTTSYISRNTTPLISWSSWTDSIIGNPYLGDGCQGMIHPFTPRVFDSTEKKKKAYISTSDQGFQ